MEEEQQQQQQKEEEEEEEEQEKAEEDEAEAEAKGKVDNWDAVNLEVASLIAHDRNLLSDLSRVCKGGHKGGIHGSTWGWYKRRTLPHIVVGPPGGRLPGSDLHEAVEQR